MQSEEVQWSERPFLNTTLEEMFPLNESPLNKVSLGMPYRIPEDSFVESEDNLGQEDVFQSRSSQSSPLQKMQQALAAITRSDAAFHAQSMERDLDKEHLQMEYASCA